MRAARHRYLVAHHDIAVGEVFTPHNVALKRVLPEVSGRGTKGLPARCYDDVLGRRAAERKNAGQYRRCLVVRRDLPADAVLTEADIGFMRVLPKAATDALAQFEPLCAVDLA